MLTKALGVCGVIMFLFGIGLGVTLLGGRVRAIQADLYVPAAPVGGPCVDALEEVILPRRTMSENDSQTITVVLSNHGAEICEQSVAINAPNFEISPAESTQLISIPPGIGTAQTGWVLTPKKQGTFEIVIRIGAEMQIVGLSVTNVLGLTPLQAQLLSSAGSVLGPMLTLPWWYERWQKRQEKQKPKKSPVGTK